MRQFFAAVETAAYKYVIFRGNLLYQLTWKILPGLRGLSCSEFQATATQAPETEKGVAIDCATDSERDTLLKELETRFAAERFSNGASAFETVKAYVLGRAAARNTAG